MASVGKTKPQTALEKEFFSRNSILTDILKNDQGDNLHVMYGVVFVGIFIKIAVRQFVKLGSVTFGLDLMRIGLFNIDNLILIWLCLFASTCIFFILFKFWATCRNLDIWRYLYVTFTHHPVHKTPNYSTATKIWDFFFLTLLVTYYIYSFILTTKSIRHHGLYFLSAMIVSLESVRFLMKVHSFLRNNVPKVVNNKVAPPLPSFSNFLYFLVAPTLIHKDDYPLRKQINWNYVGLCSLGLLSQAFMCCAIEDIIISNIQDYSLRKFSLSELAVMVVENVLFGGFFLIILFLFSSHFLPNLFAELTRFDDRLFYGDWWNSCDVGTILRKWNYIVGNWLHYYIYLDFKNKVYDNEFSARFVGFVTCFFVLKWVACLTFRGGFTVTFLTFVIVALLTLVNSPPKNIISKIFNWYALCITTTVNIFIYCTEYYAWNNVPPEISTTVELPRYLICDC